jgi:hypothetical protein
VRHRIAHTWLVVLAVLATVLGAPSTARADAPPTISRVAAADGDPGILAVTASSDSPIRALSARVSLPGFPDVSVDAFTLVAGDDTSGTWHSDRVVLGGYGRAVAAVEVLDADGDRTASPTSQWLPYYPTGIVHDGTIGPDVIDFDNQVLTFAGSLHRLDPRTGATSPWAGQRVSTSAASRNGGEAVTGPDGRYHLQQRIQETSTPGPSSAFLRVHPVEEDASYPTATVARTTFDIALSQVRFRFDVPRTTQEYGGHFTAAGTLERLTGAGWRPVPGAAVSVNGGFYEHEKTTTNAAGRFSFQVPVPWSDGQVPFAIEKNRGQNPFLAWATGAIDINVVNLVTLQWATSDLSEWSELRVQGTIRSSSSPLPKNVRVYVQQSANGRTGWRDIAYFPVTRADGHFDIVGPVDHPKGYFRLRYAGAADFQPAFSSTKRFNRHDTRIARFNAGPAKVRKGKTVVLRGVLQRKTSTSWQPFAKQRIQIDLRLPGKKKFTYVTTTRTDARGRFTVRVTAKRDAYWSAAWFTPNGRYVNASSVERLVDVR